MLNSFRIFVLLLFAFAFWTFSEDGGGGGSGRESGLLVRSLRSLNDWNLLPSWASQSADELREDSSKSKSSNTVQKPRQHSQHQQQPVGPVHELTIFLSSDSVWFPGSQVELRWAAPAFMDVDYFQLDLFSTVNRTRPLLRIASNIPSSKTLLLWTVPRDVPELEAAKIYFVRLLAFPGNSSARPRYALSESFFAIGNLGIGTPTKNVSAGSVTRIDVAATGWGALLPLTVELVDLRVPADAKHGISGLRTITIAENQSPGSSEVHWTVPFTLPPGCDYVYHVFAQSEQDPRSGVPDQIVNTTSGRFCIGRRKSSTRAGNGFAILSPAPKDNLVAGAQTQFSFTYTGVPLSSWNLDLFCVNTTQPCYLGTPLVRDLPMTRATYTITLPTNMDIHTFHFFRIWGFPVSHTGGEGEPISGTSQILWTTGPANWLPSIPGTNSAPAFRNPLITINSPLKGDRWTKSLQVSVEWSVSNTILDSYTVELHCYDLHPKTLVAVIDSHVETTRLSTTWKVPDGIPSSLRYAVRIFGHEAAFLGTAQQSAGEKDKPRELVEAVGHFFAIESHNEPRERKSDGVASLMAGQGLWATVSALLCLLLD